MRLIFSYHALALAGLFALFSVASRLFSVERFHHAPDPKSLRAASILQHRATDIGDEGEVDIPFQLGPCVPACGVSKEPRDLGAGRIKRETASFESLSNSTKRGNPFERRAQPLPAFGGPDDLRRKSRKELGEWMMRRIPDPRTAGTDVEMLWDYRDRHQLIELRQHKSRSVAISVGIPTSFFQQPGDTSFAWGTVLLVGCSVFAVVKTPTAEDPSAGVYFAHIWEVPGFANHVGPDGKLLSYALPNNWIRDFIREGFPPPTAPFKRRIPEKERDWETTFQEGLNNHGAYLKGGKAIVMHPQEYTPVDRGGYWEYVVGEGPAFPDGLTLLKNTVNEVMRRIYRSTVAWFPDYLYVPAREDDQRTRAYETPSGRTIFEYDPNFKLGNGQTTRMGMLLFEDGGEQGPLQEDGTYKPGPGGPFFFDFGRA